MCGPNFFRAINNIVTLVSSYCQWWWMVRGLSELPSVRAILLRSWEK
jgi:hypothetical protein